MNLLLISLYFIFLLCIGLVSAFIIYHLKRYSINQGLSRTLIVFFIVITVILIVLNGIAFFTIPFDDATRSSLPF